MKTDDKNFNENFLPYLHGVCSNMGKSFFYGDRINDYFAEKKIPTIGRLLIYDVFEAESWEVLYSQSYINKQTFSALAKLVGMKPSVSGSGKSRFRDYFKVKHGLNKKAILALSLCFAIPEEMLLAIDDYFTGIHNKETNKTL